MEAFGFIGVGNMGGAILKAVYKTFGPDEIVYFDLAKDKCSEIAEQLNIEPEINNAAVVSKCKYLVLAVKPQFLADALRELRGLVTKDHIVISIAAGVKIHTIKALLGVDIRVVRAMPNTPALINKGITGVTYSSDSFNDAEKTRLDEFFRSFGEYELFSEDLINAVTCASGSSPAYVYTFIEALADSVVSLGIPRDKAYRLAAHTVAGAASMVIESGEHPGVLKDQVCSPGGTTIAGIKALEEFGFRNAVMKATDACYKRANVLSAE